MTEDEHRNRHIDLHKALDELIADWAAHQPKDSSKMYSNTTIAELMEWSYRQTSEPESLKCLDCGAKAPAGEPCPNCGLGS